MGINKKLKKGFNINLAGKAAETIVEANAKSFAVKPSEFPGLEKPKVLVKAGDTVKAGDPLYYDKSMPEVKFTSPVSGEVTDIIRGEKRKLLAITVVSDTGIQYKDFGKTSASDLANQSREDVIQKIVESGVWPQMIQRPFSVIANPADTPKSIYISGFESGPLAPEYSILLQNKETDFKMGVDVLKKLTSGRINISVNADQEILKAYSLAKGVEVHKFSGPHPVGNVGVQIHHIDPINKGDIVWTINPVGVAQLGKLFNDGVYDASKIIALAGSDIKNPQYYKTYSGVCVHHLIEYLFQDL